MLESCLLHNALHSPPPGALRVTPQWSVTPPSFGSHLARDWGGASQWIWTLLPSLHLQTLEVGDRVCAVEGMGQGISSSVSAYFLANCPQLLLRVSMLASGPSRRLTLPFSLPFVASPHPYFPSCSRTHRHLYSESSQPACTESSLWVWRSLNALGALTHWTLITLGRHSLSLLHIKDKETETHMCSGSCLKLHSHLFSTRQKSFLVHMN